MKKILIVNQNSGYLTIDVANSFSEQYHQVVVMFGKNKVTDRTFNSKIKIQKTIVYNRTNAFMRILTWGLFTIHLFFLLSFKYRGYTILYYTNPPISYFNSLFFSNPFSIVVFDTYPDALKLIGINDKNIIFKIWSRINRKVFSQAEHIFTLSEGMKEQLSFYVNKNQIKVVPIWPATEKLRPIPKTQNEFLRKHNWLDRFIILYSGNMGMGHKLEILIDIAEGLQENKKILFLFIGEGAKKETLVQLTKNKKLKNIEFLPWQGAEILHYSLASADLAVVALEPNATHSSVPSKTFNYMAVGAPLLGIGGENSELQIIIDKNKNGFYLSSECFGNAISFIEDIFNDSLMAQELSSNSLKGISDYSFSNSQHYIF
jgi:hypothetical protein